MNRYVCIHGHFYQPPRENPWTGEIDRHAGAVPYRDWNERVHAECYRPSTAARILDDEGRIAKIVNTYSRTSFNVGPTLLRWLERAEPATYNAIVRADREGVGLLGAGPAIAQAYNHIILPLANERDKDTQVAWGMADFRARFGREATGMWLPETAADTASLDALARAGVRFTVLAPKQCDAVRKIGEEKWTGTPDGSVNTTVPYLVRTAGGRSIAAFFYNGPLSRKIAFDGILENGADLADALVGPLDKEPPTPALSHVATDGETYGHHHGHGEMALAFALERIEHETDAELTCYERFLELCPPTHEARIVEPSAWSCEHGVDRWKADCGCASGEHPDWNQVWRGPLRSAMDELRDSAESFFESAASELLADPWAARDGYVSVILDRSKENIGRFFETYGATNLREPRRDRAIRLLDAQRYAMLMYTSCGWFFDDVGSLETTQALRYAQRAAELFEKEGLAGAQNRLLRALQAAKSNKTKLGDGARIHKRFVLAAAQEPTTSAAAAAATALYTDEPGTVHNDEVCVEIVRMERCVADGTRCTAGIVRVQGPCPGHERVFLAGAVQDNDGGIRAGAVIANTETNRVLDRAAASGTARAVLDNALGAALKPLHELSAEMQGRVAEASLDAVSAEIHTAYGALGADAHATNAAGNATAIYRAAAARVRFRDVQAAAAAPVLCTETWIAALHQARDTGIDGPLLRRLVNVIEKAVANTLPTTTDHPSDAGGLARAAAVVRAVRGVDANAEFWEAQTACWNLAHGNPRSAGHGPRTDAVLTELCDALCIRGPAKTPPEATE